jgi:hypothetical protein
MRSRLRAQQPRRWRGPAQLGPGRSDGGAQPDQIRKSGCRSGVPGHDEAVGSEVAPLGSWQDVSAAGGWQHHGLRAGQRADGEHVSQRGAAGVLRHGRVGDQQARLAGGLAAVGPSARHAKPARTKRPGVEASELLGDDAGAGHRWAVFATSPAAAIDRCGCIDGGVAGGNPRRGGGIGKHSGVTIRRLRVDWSRCRALPLWSMA